MDFYADHMVQYAGLEKDPPDLWAFALANLVWGALLAWILFRTGAVTAAKGAVTGGLVADVRGAWRDRAFSEHTRQWRL